MVRGTFSALLLAFTVFVGCSEEAPASFSVTKTQVVTQKDQSSKEVGPISEQRRKRPLVVGGCGDSCASGADSFVNYMQLLANEQRGSFVVPFLETSLLVHNGEFVAEDWVQLWKDGKLRTRAQKIEDFSNRIHGWAKQVDGAEFEQALANGVRYGEDDKPGILVYFTVPKSLRTEAVTEWRYRIQQRGWEWLVSEITTVGFE